MRLHHSGVLASFAFLLSFPVVHAATLKVGPEGYSTITAAIAAAQAGDTVEVSAGSFSENVVLDKRLFFRGPNHAVAAYVSPPVRMTEAVLGGGIKVLATASGSEISGFRFTGGTVDAAGDFAVNIEAANITVKNSIINQVGIGSGNTNSYAIITAPTAVTPVISGNLVSGNRNGILLRSSGAGEVADNIIIGNSLGIDLESQDPPVITGNAINSNDIGVRARGVAEGVSAGMNVFEGNLIAIQNSTANPIDARRNHWNTGERPPLSSGGNSVTGSVGISPWYADDAFTRLVNGVLENTTLSEGEVLLADVLYMAPGKKLIVDNGTLDVGKLDMDPEAVLEVNDGLVKLGVPGGSHTIGGTFRVTHSLGSIEVIGDTEFSGDTLALASDFHVASGVTLRVSGSLVLDGCFLDGPAGWNLVATPSSTLEVVRCRFEKSTVELNSGLARITSSRFSSSTVRVTPSGSGAVVRHNVFPDGPGSFVIQPGATAVTSGEGWGNVSADGGTANRMLLSFRQPLLPGRSLGADGTLFIQPGDSVIVNLAATGLLTPIQAAEALVAFHTGYLNFDHLELDSRWGNELFLGAQTGSLLGKVDAAAGLSFGIGAPDGTLVDSEIADFHFTSNVGEGRTAVFFRNPTAGDPFHSNTRLTGSVAGIPHYVEEPFTENAGEVVIDGTAPLIEAGATASQGTVDLLQDGVPTRIGTVEVVLKALDSLAGIDSGHVLVQLTGPSNIQAVFSSRTVGVPDGVAYDQFVFHVPVSATTPDGEYTVSATVTDRSGNQSSVTIGAIEVVKYIAQVTVASQGIVNGVTRDVTFVGTDAVGGILFTMVKPVSFVSGAGSAILEGISVDVAHLSAKTSWTLRRKIPCVLDVAGDASASFTGAFILRGGDFNGDNLINLPDHNFLNARWFSTNEAADINGDGGVTLADFNIMNSNWFTAGDQP